MGPYDYLCLLIPEEYYQEVADETNLYAEQREEEKGSVDSYWKPVTAQDIKLYFHINIIMGIHGLPEYCMFRSSDGQLRVPGVADIMGKTRYEKISQYFHLHDRTKPEAARNTPQYDPLHKVRPLIELLRTNIAQVYKPGANISLDEAMIAFNDRLTFKQYLKGKPNPWGIKVWRAADSSTGYLLDFNIYTGKVNEPMPHGSGHHVIMKVGRPFLHKHHHFYYDNYFSSLQLTNDLLIADTYSCSTVRPNRKGWPTALKPQNTKSMVRGDVRFKQQGNIVATVWRDKRYVSVLTSNTMPGTVTVSRRTHHGRINVDILATIATYNKYMGGVDRFDQLSSYYPVGRKSVKWWRYIFRFLLQTALVNSWIIYKTSFCPHPKARDINQISFRLAVSDALVKGNIKKRKSPVQQPATAGVGAADLLEHRLIRITGSKLACFWCVKHKLFTKRGRARETVYGCNLCQIRLCKGDCFTLYHDSLH